jgi:hypothetical protein
MKNVHLIPTDKPSMLYSKDGNHKLANSTMAMDWYISSAGYKPINIYITSDEEIKEDDYRMNIQRGYFKKSDKEGLDYYNKRNDVFKKIILTTDQDLIKDGVQSINDTFLEWFVKNPSCEEVEVENHYRIKSGTIQEHRDGIAGYEYYEYKIIIPKEEPKQLNPKDFGLPQLGTKEFNNLAMEMFGGKPKQETLEEFANNYSKDPFVITGVLIGAKWQAERIGLMEIELNHTKTLLASCEKALEDRDKKVKRMYSEEEVGDLFKKYQYDLAQWVLRMEDDINGKPMPIEWFEQFKKKQSGD